MSVTPKEGEEVLLNGEMRKMARILVIDDDSGVRSMLRCMFERSGYEVITASDGKEGLSICHSVGVDLVITDIFMPVQDGFETILRIRKELPRLKIVVISGGGKGMKPDGYLHMANAFGSQCVFKKPFNRNEMLKAVRDLLGEQCHDKKSDHNNSILTGKFDRVR